jgi:hypothetical protein
MIDYNKYHYTGWGLSKEALQFLEQLIINNSLKSAIEFGSGQSTYFLEDINIDYVSYDDDPHYAAPFKNVKISKLKELDNETFNKVIHNEVNYIDVNSKFPSPVHVNTRQRNCFYTLNKEDIKGKFDLVLLDGPNGNGRSLSYNVLKDYLLPTSYILIDDYTHYPFVDDLKLTYPNSELIHEYKNGRDEWCVYKIIL